MPATAAWMTNRLLQIERITAAQDTSNPTTSKPVFPRSKMQRAILGAFIAGFVALLGVPDAAALSFSLDLSFFTGEHLLKLIDRKDADRLTPADVATLLASLGVATPKVASRVARFDGDGDGSLSADELDVAMEFTRVTLVRWLDDDADGRLSVAEARSLIPSMDGAVDINPDGVLCGAEVDMLVNKWLTRPDGLSRAAVKSLRSLLEDALGRLLGLADAILPALTSSGDLNVTYGLPQYLEGVLFQQWRREDTD